MDNVFPSSKNNPLFRCCSPSQEDPLFLSHFPSPFVDDISATQLLPLPLPLPLPIPSQKYRLMAYQNENNMFEYPNKALNIHTVLYSSSIANEPTPEIKPKKIKRSSGKKDRHSKIHTAHGLRGRRMRLSIHIARKFFDLQDMLGFDKASKTLDWLFSNSKKAIKELTQTLPSDMRNNQGTCNGERGKSAMLECESGSDNIIAKRNSRVGSRFEALIPHRELTRKPRKSRKSAHNPNDPVKRESREKARARARERTSEKMMKEKTRRCEWWELNPNTTNLDKQGLGSTSNPNKTNIERLRSPKNLFEPPSSHGQDTNFLHEDQLTNTEIVPKSLIPSFSEFGQQKSSAPSGRVDFSIKSLNILENQDSRNLRISPSSSMDPFTPIFEGKNPICVPVITINRNFHSQHLQKRSAQFP